MSGFYHRHFLKLLDFMPAELSSLLQLAARLKVDKKSGKEEIRFIGKNIALIFKKNSTHTRCSFEIAAYDQGTRVTYLGPSGNQTGHKESIKDTARVFGRVYGGIQYRGYGQEIVEALTEYAGVPAWNGLTNEFHPMQLLTDLLTMQEHLPGKAFDEMTLVYAGDARSNTGNSMLETAAPTGLGLHLVTPQVCWPEAALVAERNALAQKHGSKITLMEDTTSGVKDADFVYTDIWVLMGEPKEKWAERIALLRDYQMNSKMVALTGSSQAKFLHCLSAFHDEQTTPDEKMAAEFGLYGGMGVTDGVSESPASIVFDQAESRMHVIKAVMATTLAK